MIKPYIFIDFTEQKNRTERFVHLKERFTNERALFDTMAHLHLTLQVCTWSDHNYITLNHTLNMCKWTQDSLWPDRFAPFRSEQEPILNQINIRIDKQA